MRRSALRTLITAGTVLATVVAIAPSAHAATALTPTVPVVASAADTYTFATTLPYWTAVAVRPAASADYDLDLVDQASGAVLATSHWGGAATDVVAINSNAGHRPLGGYAARVFRYSGAGDYSVMFWQKREVMSVPTDPVGGTATALGLTFASPVYTVQLYLQAGQGMRVYRGTNTRVYLAGSTPGQPATSLRNRSALENAYVVADNVPSPGGGVCRVFVAPSAGWYAVVLIWNTPLTPPPYNGGNAVFPQRYDPSKGDKLTDCPAPQVP
jgi:hypothetical protein